MNLRSFFLFLTVFLLMNDIGRKSYVKKTILISISILFLLLGGFIYLFFRPHTLNMFVWLRIINCEQFFQLREYNHNLKFLDFLIFSFPNGLWVLSFLIILGLIWKKHRIFFIIYSSFFTGISILFEFFQKFGLIPGTFDIADIIVLLSSHILGFLIYDFFILEVSYEKQNMD